MQKRTLRDSIISGMKSIYYTIAESSWIHVVRLQNGEKYEKNDHPLISVYCPSYNRGKLLMDRAVNSVLSQTYQNFEFLIVGDHCTDDTEKLVTAITDKRVRFHNLPQKSAGYPITVEGRWFAGGIGPANAALPRLRGDWIARIDDDDIWTPDHLETLIKFARDGNYEFVSSLHEERRFNETKIVRVDAANSSYYNPARKSPSVDTVKIGGHNTWVYRSYLRFMKYNIDCWRKKWNKPHDIDLSIRFFNAGVRMGFLDKVTAFIYPRPGEKTIGLDAYKEAERVGSKEYYE